jgi:hypothetical protein
MKFGYIRRWLILSTWCFYLDMDRCFCGHKPSRFLRVMLDQSLIQHQNEPMFFMKSFRFQRVPISLYQKINNNAESTLRRQWKGNEKVAVECFHRSLISKLTCEPSSKCNLDSYVSTHILNPSPIHLKAILIALSCYEISTDAVVNNYATGPTLTHI